MDMVLLIQPRILIRDGDHLARVRDFLRTDAQLVARDPEQRGLRADARMVIGCALDFGRVAGGFVGVGHPAAQLLVAAVLVRAEVADEEVGRARGFTVGGLGGEALLGGVDGFDAVLALVLAWGAGAGFVGVRVLAGVAVVALLAREERLFLGFEVLGQEVDQRGEGAVEREMVDDDEDEEDDHEDQGAECDAAAGCADGEQANQADHQKVAADSDVLQGADERFALRVDVRVGDVQHVVAIGKVEEIETDGCEAHDERSDTRVRDG